MGRTRMTAAEKLAASTAAKPSDPTATLLADNVRLEKERVELLAKPRTVANQIDHQWLSVRMLSNLRSLAMLRGKVGEVVSLTGAIDKAEDALRGLQKIKVDDQLEAMAARIQGFDDARHILADVKDEE